jgi:hypothetical protein
VITQQETRQDTTINAAVTAILLGVGLAVLWVVLGFWRPTTTYHLAPLLIGATPAVFAGGVVDRRAGALLAAAGLGLALGAFWLLAVVPGLDGPPVGPFSNAIQESVVLAFVGAVGGGLYATVIRRG